MPCLSVSRLSGCHYSDQKVGGLIPGPALDMSNCPSARFWIPPCFCNLCYISVFDMPDNAAKEEFTHTAFFLWVALEDVNKWASPCSPHLPASPPRICCSHICKHLKQVQPLSSEWVGWEEGKGGGRLHRTRCGFLKIFLKIFWIMNCETLLQWNGWLDG